MAYFYLYLSPALAIYIKIANVYVTMQFFLRKMLGTRFGFAGARFL